MPHPRAEIEATLVRYLDLRRRIDAGEETGWTGIADFFTDDCVYIDPAWGRVEGIAELREFLDESMRGLEDWTFPVEYTAIEGDQVVVKWTQITPPGPDGTRYRQSGYSTLLYAGDGRFSYEEDLLNMAHVNEDLRASGWRPQPGFVMPPAAPNRDLVAPVSDAPNVEQRDYWNSDEGAVWVRDETRYDEMLAPFATALLDAAAPAPAARVLDVGCGTGATTLAAARIVADATATGIDISRPMIEGARRRAEREGVTNVTFEVHDAQVDPIDASADLLLSRFGVMFFDDPIAAFVNLHRAIAPGGRLAFVCWQPLFVNEWMTVPALAVAEHVPLPEPAGPGTPGPFAFGDADHVRGILDAAGFTGVTITPFETPLLLGGRGGTEGAVDFLLADRDRPGVADGRALRRRHPALQSVHDALEAHHDGEGIRLGSATWIVQAAA